MSGWCPEMWGGQLAGVPTGICHFVVPARPHLPHGSRCPRTRRAELSVAQSPHSRNPAEPTRRRCACPLFKGRFGAARTACHFSLVTSCARGDAPFASSPRASPWPLARATHERTVSFRTLSATTAHVRTVSRCTRRFHAGSGLACIGAKRIVPADVAAARVRACIGMLAWTPPRGRC